MLDKMRTLVDKLNAASEAYYGGKDTVMSDKEYDELCDQLEELERETCVVLPDSPTINVGYESGSPLAKTAHEYRSLSLNDTKDLDKLAKWMGNHQAVLSWKCDGLTVILTYDNGRLIRAATRGDGSIGEDITRNAVNFENVPLRINDHRHIIIRGEGVVPYSAFNAVNSTLPAEKQYKNPRNMAAGAAKVITPEKTANYGIRFIPFDVANAYELGITKMSESLTFIQSVGLTPVEWQRVDSSSIRQIIEAKEKEVDGLPYPTDGLVVTYDNLELCRNLGATQKYPKYAMAFKWADKLETTVLRGIEWSVAKTGLISPVAVFDPVNLEGTTVKRANLHNISVAQELGLGIGDRIRVYKANMIIPKIHDSLDKSGGIDIIDKCPVCGHKVVRRTGVNGRSLFVHCINPACSAKR